MWTLIVIVLVSSGQSIGGVSSTMSSIDFPDKVKCEAAAKTFKPWKPSESAITPVSAVFSIRAQCVER